MNSESSTPGTDVYGGAPIAQSQPTKGGLSADTKKRAAISAAALLLAGGGALAVMATGTEDKPVPPPVPNPVPPTGETPDVSKSIALPPNATEAKTVSDDMDFDNAFASARDEVGLGGVFVWHGKAYNTFLKEEWTSLSVQQRQEYAEHVLDTELPVAVQEPVAGAGKGTPPSSPISTQAVDPTVIEGTMGDRRVMGIDQDNDGVIDVLVLEGEDGYNYRVADASGGEGLDTLYVFDTVKDEYVLVARLDQPVLLGTDDLSANLEDAMSQEVTNAILADPAGEAASEAATPNFLPNEDPDGADMQEETTRAQADLDQAYEADGYGDTYVNNANVSDMDEPHH